MTNYLGLKAAVVFYFPIIFIAGCVNSRAATYFNDLGDGIISSKVPLLESIIQKNDILSISVTSLNPEATVIFNTPTNSSGGLTTMQSGGYIVSIDGTLEFPVLGSIKAEGLTKSQLKETITAAIISRKLLLEPNVMIRFLNFRVTVLGEVGRPAVVTVPSEKLSLLEALGLAGDMTIFAKRDNVLIIREENNNKIIKRLDLNSQDLFSSPYYYLQSNDIVYVSPNKAKVSSAKETRIWLPSLLSGLALIASIIRFSR